MSYRMSLGEYGKGDRIKKTLKQDLATDSHISRILIYEDLASWNKNLQLPIPFDQWQGLGVEQAHWCILGPNRR